ncbi:DotI/IcmL/TraM family protein [uncultured Amphritea sp.]|uniref:DotI/IcmL/TraM family protein n=1 Tax=uncultured Amphritea sp. TaxID=981605 RepID=UPI00262383F2|nr:DotI/IcmL/TraM family protein [uncultured Amphritea sp.]
MNQKADAALDLATVKNELKEYQEASSVLADLLSEERKDSRKLAGTALKYSLIFNVVLMGVVVFLAEPKTNIEVLQQRADGSLAQLATTDRPYYELKEIKEFARKRAVAVHSWGYGDYVQVLEDEREVWDKQPLKDYVNTLVDQGVFTEAKKYRRRFEAFLLSPVDVSQQIKYDGDYRMYRVIVHLQDESVDIEGVSSAKWKITLDVREQNPKEGHSGLKVARYDEVVVK